MRRGRYPRNIGLSPVTSTRTTSKTMHITLKTKILETWKTENSEPLYSENMIKTRNSTATAGYGRPALQEEYFHHQQQNRNECDPNLSVSSVDCDLYLQRAYNSGFIGGRSPEASSLRTSNLNTGPCAEFYFGHTHFPHISSHRTTDTCYRIAQDDMAVSTRNKWDEKLLSYLPTSTRLSGADIEDCPYSHDIETLVGALSSQIDNVLDMHTYTDEKKLAILQRRYYV